jgi:flavin-binding protein dodecin
MSSHVYRITEVVGSSPNGVDDAIRNAVRRASKTIRKVEWFEMVSVRGHVADGDVAHTHVTLKVGFRLDDPE